MASSLQAVFVFDIEDVLITTIEAGGNSTVQRESTTIEVIDKAVESVKEILALCKEREVSPLFFIYTLNTNLEDIHSKIDLFSSRIPGFRFDKILHPTSATNPRKTYEGIVHLYSKFHRGSGRPSCPVFIFDTEVYVSDEVNVHPFKITDAAFDEGHSWDLALRKVKEGLPVIPVAPTPLAPGSLVGTGGRSSFELSPMLGPINLTPTKRSGGKRSGGKRQSRVRKSKKARKTRKGRTRGTKK
jgi:hypothetical protein